MNKTEAYNTLSDIKQMMEKSTKFMSLNGLSSICAGIYALIAAALAYLFLGYNNGTTLNLNVNTPSKLNSVTLAAVVLVGLCLLTAYALSSRKAKKSGHRLKFDHATKRLLWNFFVPLVAGGIMCLSLLYHGHYGLTSSVMLIFYGLAQISASNYTYSNTKYLGYAILLLGLIDCFVSGYGLLFWTIGFGFFHIIYGLLFYIKYDRRK